MIAACSYEVVWQAATIAALAFAETARRAIVDLTMRARWWCNFEDDK